MCKCITVEDKSKIQCVEMNQTSKNNTYILNHEVTDSCEDLNVDILKKLILNKKIDYCGDIHPNYLDSQKYKIDAGFFIKDESESFFYLFKNTEINGSRCVLFRIEDFFSGRPLTIWEMRNPLLFT